MPACTLTPTTDASTGGWLDFLGLAANLYLNINEGFTLPVDTANYIQAPTDTNSADYKCSLLGLPLGEYTLRTLNWRVRYALSAAIPASSRDTYGLAIRVMSGATVLAAGSAAGAFQTVISGTAISTTYANTAVTAFTYVNTAATAAQWAVAQIELRQTYTKNGSNDVHAMRVSAVELTGAYNPILVGSSTSLPITGLNTKLLTARKLLASVGSYGLNGAAVFSLGRTLIGGAGSLLITAGSAALLCARNFPGNETALPINGVAALLAKRRLSLSPGLYDLGGNAVFACARVFTGDTEALEINGDGLLSLTRRLFAETMIYELTGAALLLREYKIQDAGATLNVGGASEFLCGRVLSGDTEIGLPITGELVALRGLICASESMSLGITENFAAWLVNRRLIANPLTLTITGLGFLLRQYQWSLENQSFLCAGESSLRVARVLTATELTIPIAYGGVQLVYGGAQVVPPEPLLRWPLGSGEWMIIDGESSFHATRVLAAAELVVPIDCGGAQFIAPGSLLRWYLNSGEWAITDGEAVFVIKGTAVEGNSWNADLKYFPATRMEHLTEYMPITLQK